MSYSATEQAPYAPTDARNPGTRIMGLALAISIGISPIAENSYLEHLAKSVSENAASDSCYKPTTDDFGAIDNLLENGDSAPDYLYVASDTIDPAQPDPLTKEYKVTTWGGAYATTAGANARLEANNTGGATQAQFDTLNGFFRQHLGLTLSMNTKDKVWGKPADPSAATEGKVDVHEIPAQALADLADQVLPLPTELFQATGITGIQEFKLVPSKDGHGFGGYITNESPDIHLERDEPGAARHEIGHKIDETVFCGKVGTHDPGYTALDDSFAYPRPDAKSDRAPGHVSEEQYASVFRNEISQQQNIISSAAKQAGWPRAHVRDFIQAMISVARRHKAAAAEVTEASNYGLTSEVEAKAEIWKGILAAGGDDDNVNQMLTPGKPLAKKVRYLLAQAYGKFKNTYPSLIPFLIERSHYPTRECIDYRVDQ